MDTLLAVEEVDARDVTEPNELVGDVDEEVDGGDWSDFSSK